MSLHAMPHPDGSPKPPSVHQAEDGNGEAGTLGVGSSSTTKESNVTKPRWTARRTHAQFSLYYFPFTSRRERQEQRDAQLAALSAGKVAEPLENATTSSSAVSTSEEPQAAAAGKQTAVESEPVQSPERLQTNGENQPLPDPAASTSATNLTMNDQAMHDTKVFDAEAAAVPRTFDYTDLTFSSDESDKDASMQSPNFTAKAPPVHDGSFSFPDAQGLTAASAYGLAQPTTKAEPASTPRHPRTQVQVLNNGESREYIYIDSSDESEEGEDDTSSPIRRLTLEESSFDIPAMEVPAASVEDVVSPKMTEDDPFAEHQPPSDEDEPMGDAFEPTSPEMARMENESSEDNIPLAILRKNLSPTTVEPATNENETSEHGIPLAILRKNVSAVTVEPTRNETESSEDDIPLAILRKTLSPVIVKSTSNENENEISEDNVPIVFLRTNRSRSKRHLSDDEGDEEADFSLVNRPAPTSRPRALLTKRHRNFDSDAFDAMIYSQSETSPPRGVSVPRPTTATTRVASHDDRRYVAANPAIHGLVRRPEKWWRDKIREIRARPSRKAWFGRAPERMRWLHQKQRQEQEELQRHSRNPKAGRGSKIRHEPQPAGCRRLVDFGDVQEQQLPQLVRSNPEWAKACEWMRAKWKDDGEMRRVVEHSAQRTWDYYQKALQEHHEQQD